MSSYLSIYTGTQIDTVIGLFHDKGLANVTGVVQRNSDGSFSIASIPPGTVQSVTAGAGLNTTSDDTGTDGGTITSTGTLYLTKSGATAGSYGDSAAQTPGYGSTFKVPYITVDKYGRVTAISEHTVKSPASDDTTYTFATGDANGQIKVTPSGGRAQNVDVKGLTAVAFTAVANSITSGGTGIPNAGVIYSYVAEAIAASDAMIYKGSLGTGGDITALPTTYKTGWTYRVITAGTYAGVKCEVGDLITALVDRSGSGNLDSDWSVGQTNIDGAVVGPASATDGYIPLFDGTTGKLLKNSTYSPSSFATAGHTHGNITNAGAITADGVAIANGDTIVIVDSSDSSKIKKTSITFDGSTATKALTQKGTWETFNNYSLPLAASGTRGGVQIGYSTDDANRNYAVQLSSEKMYVNVPWTDTTYTAGTGLSLSGTEFSVKLDYTTSGVNRKVQADSSGNLYVIQQDTTYSAAKNDTLGLVKPWYNHTVASTGPTAGSDATAITVNAISTTADRYYAVEIDSNGRLFVNVPWLVSGTGTVTSVSAGAGLTTAGDDSSSAGSAITTTGTLSLRKSGATAGSYGPSANANPGYAGTFSVPYVTVDKYGRVTSISSKTITMPTDHTSLSPASGGTDVSLVTTGEKYRWNNKTDLSLITVTLSYSGWNNKTQIVSAQGVTASNDVVISAIPADNAEYIDSGMLCTAQGASTLTFTCDVLPTRDLTVNVLIFS